MDPLPFPPGLPPLSYAGESLIARIHVYISLGRVAGHQYKYSGHICNFFNNTPKLAKRLPRLPEELEELILKPASMSLEDAIVQKAFDHKYRVKRRDIDI